MTGVRSLVTIVLAGVLVAPHDARAQDAADPHLLRLQATPFGALPPMALPMPASRDDNYWGARLQAGTRSGRGGADPRAIAGGIDLQWQGGSVFGITGGYRTRDCDPPATDCGGHALFGARARFNVITGGPTIAALFGDYSATSTLGAELGLGYAPDVAADLDACTVAIGVPLSLAMLQTARLVAFVTPGVAWDIDCAAAGRRARASTFAGLGLGVQQLGLRGLDVYLGALRILRSGSGSSFGISVTYVRLP